MEKMPFREAESIGDVQAVMAAATKTEATDWRQKLPVLTGTLAAAGTDGVVRQAMSDAGGVLVDESGSSLLGFDGQDGFDREVEAWVAAVGDGRPLPVTAADGRAALAAALAAERSIVTGRATRVSRA